MQRIVILDVEENIIHPGNSLHGIFLSRVQENTQLLLGQISKDGKKVLFARHSVYLKEYGYKLLSRYNFIKSTPHPIDTLVSWSLDNILLGGVYIVDEVKVDFNRKYGKKSW